MDYQLKLLDLAKDRQPIFRQENQACDENVCDTFICHIAEQHKVCSHECIYQQQSFDCDLSDTSDYVVSDLYLKLRDYWCAGKALSVLDKTGINLRFMRLDVETRLKEILDLVVDYRLNPKIWTEAADFFEECMLYYRVVSYTNQDAILWNMVYNKILSFENQSKSPTQTLLIIVDNLLRLFYAQRYHYHHSHGVSTQFNILVWCQEEPKYYHQETTKELLTLLHNTKVNACFDIERFVEMENLIHIYLLFSIYNTRFKGFFKQWKKRMLSRITGDGKQDWVWIAYTQFLQVWIFRNSKISHKLMTGLVKISKRLFHAKNYEPSWVLQMKPRFPPLFLEILADKLVKDDLWRPGKKRIILNYANILLGLHENDIVRFIQLVRLSPTKNLCSQLIGHNHPADVFLYIVDVHLYDNLAKKWLFLKNNIDGTVKFPDIMVGREEIYNKMKQIGF